MGHAGEAETAVAIEFDRRGVGKMRAFAVHRTPQRDRDFGLAFGAVFGLASISAATGLSAVTVARSVSDSSPNDRPLPAIPEVWTPR